MRSAFAVFLRGFVLPFGATVGRRIFFDGLTATINLFDAANNLFGTLTAVGGVPGFFIFGTDGSQVALQTVIATGETQIENLTLGNVFRIANARIETDTTVAAGPGVGTVIARLEVFDDTGTSIGFLPIYDAIP